MQIGECTRDFGLVSNGNNTVAVSSDPKLVGKYKKLSKIITDQATLKKLRGLFDRRYSLQELLDWEHARLKFAKEEIVRHNDPLEIIDYGKGRCGEFSNLFTALCLAHDYRARIVLDLSDHVWSEVWNSKADRWVHADPSEKRYDDPKMYVRDWKKNVKEVYAFENGKIEDVTENYR
jgi:transglutaminase-like putative cysteine protease